jgi:hypothetical protein
MVHQKDLKENYFLFGNKGSVWSNTAHIYKGSEGNLCGTPALSTNWVRIEGVEVAGCQECIDIYNNKLKELNK